ncbi:MAG: hypothetical protein H0U38_04090 [Chloroflexia bacterium]|jgi:hypothetical protein|nr:hypothetical protein [Chloroflexia bacterium]MDQ3613494.1 hypothetical protein [Chloroflexota bacterium]
MTEQSIRLPLLKRLAEQAMADSDFRSVARDDMELALVQFGYELNDRERAFVFRFRQALEEANVDLKLAKEVDLDALLDDTEDPEGLEQLINSHFP